MGLLAENERIAGTVGDAASLTLLSSSITPFICERTCVGLVELIPM